MKKREPQYCIAGSFLRQSRHIINWKDEDSGKADDQAYRAQWNQPQQPYDSAHEAAGALRHAIEWIERQRGITQRLAKIFIRSGSEIARQGETQATAVKKRKGGRKRDQELGKGKWKLRPRHGHCRLAGHQAGSKSQQKRDDEGQLFG